jgi:hypothetical protein
MFLPVGAAFGAPRVAIPTRAIELRPVLAGMIELRPIAKWTIAFGAILTGARKTRTITIPIVRLVATRLVEFWAVEVPRALTGGTRLALSAIRRSSISLLPRLGIAAVAAKFPVAIRTTTKILPWTA